MKNISEHLNESLNEDTIKADTMISDIRKFVTKILKIKKSDEEAKYVMFFDDILTLCTSAIENLEYSISGAVNEAASDKMAKNVSSMLKHAELLLTQIKELSKSTKTLSSEIFDAVVDFNDILERFEELQVAMKPQPKTKTL